MPPELLPDSPRRERDRGGTAAEYALVASLIAVVIAAAVGTLGTEVLGLFQAAADGFP
ncbi:Flp family type IVb pilin [Ornithinimicrobium murale]|uniref:Flp family type IVb pilin n=1 Tax=Ornithinimicrobium murale TaxID=1050153 RepID=UPI000E0D834E|nr:Flp family type IVb pilin [Ornithinimicrobium murale]